MSANGEHLSFLTPRTSCCGMIRGAQVYLGSSSLYQWSGEVSTDCPNSLTVHSVARAHSPLSTSPCLCVRACFWLRACVCECTAYECVSALRVCVSADAGPSPFITRTSVRTDVCRVVSLTVCSVGDS